jgi:hypothetical protein
LEDISYYSLCQTTPKPQPFSESTSERLSGGKQKDLLKPSKRHPDKEDTTSTHIQLQLNLFEPPLSTLLVSSHAQQNDLNRQVAALSNLYPSAEVIAEVGGGLNFKRKKLLALLERVMLGDIERIVIAHKDRLARFGFDLFGWFCQQFNCQILVLNERSLSPEEEMVEDILAILHCFSSRLYGLRKYKTQVKEDPNLPKLRTQKNLE